MTTGREIIYWDCCVLLSWIKGEPRPDEVQARMEEVAQAVTQGRMRLITSVLTRTEVLQSTLTDEARAKYEGVLQRRSINEISVDVRVATLASEIRDYYRRKDMKLKTPDAIHVATAILYRGDELHTFDHSDLIRLNGNVAEKYPMKIMVPHKPLGPLFDTKKG